MLHVTDVLQEELQGAQHVRQATGLIQEVVLTPVQEELSTVGMLALLAMLSALSVMEQQTASAIVVLLQMASMALLAQHALAASGITQEYVPHATRPVWLVLGQQLIAHHAQEVYTQMEVSV
jgi:hypothetical protein